MTHLHLFNPGHDLALAAGIANFTPPAAAVRLAQGLAYIPAFWAQEGDAVLVDDKEKVARLSLPFKPWMADVAWIDRSELPGWVKKHRGSFSFVPWGWDEAVCGLMTRAGVPPEALLPQKRLQDIRRLSGRAASVDLLRDMKCDMPWVEGLSQVVHSIDEIEQCLMEWGGGIVLKSPWSCSGRGVKFIPAANHDDAPFALSPLAAWARRVLDTQGYLTVEKFLDKVLDFGMEFFVHEDGGVEYGGLSVFSADHGAYSGNVIDSEEQKTMMICRWVSCDCLNSIRQWVGCYLGRLLKGIYSGPLGIDMMVVNTSGGYAVDPCVEINLRRTMGHLAIALYQRGIPASRFAIENYQLHIFK